MGIMYPCLRCSARARLSISCLEKFTNNMIRSRSVSIKAASLFDIGFRAKPEPIQDFPIYRDPSSLSPDIINLRPDDLTLSLGKEEQTELYNIVNEIESKLIERTASEQELDDMFSQLFQKEQYIAVVQLWTRWRSIIESGTAQATLSDTRTIALICFCWSRFRKSHRCPDIQATSNFFSPMRPPGASEPLKTRLKEADLGHSFRRQCTSLATALDKSYAQPGSRDYFEQLNTLFAQYRANEAWRLYKAIIHRRDIDSAVLKQFLRGFHGIDKPRMASHVWATILERGLDIDPSDWTAWLRQETRKCSLRQVQSAWQTIKDHKVEIDTALITTYIDGLFKCHEIDLALKQFQDMLSSKSPKTAPNSITCNVILNGLVNNDCLDYALAFLSRAMQSGMKPDATSYNVLFAAFTKAGDNKQASHVLHQMKAAAIAKDTATYTILLDNLLKGASKIETIASISRRVLDQMTGENVKPNAHTYSTIIKHLLRDRESSGDAGDETVPSAAAIASAEQYLSEMKARYISRTIAVYESILTAKMLREDTVGASRLWHEMTRDRVQPDASAWNVMIKGLVKSNNLESAYSFFVDMLQFGILPRKQTYSYLLNGCAAGNNTYIAKLVLQHMNESNFQVDSDGMQACLVIQADFIGLYSALKRVCSMGIDTSSVSTSPRYLPDHSRQHLTRI